MSFSISPFSPPALFPAPCFSVPLSRLLSSSIALAVSFSHHYCLSPLTLSFRHMSLGVIHPANAFYGLNPFSRCVFTGLGAGIDLPLFLPSLVSSLSLASLWFSPCSPTVDSSQSLFPFSFAHLTLSFSTSHFLSLCFCVFNIFFHYTFIPSILPPPVLTSPVFLSLPPYTIPPPHCFACSISPFYISLDSFCPSSYTFMAYNSFIQYVSVCACV